MSRSWARAHQTPLFKPPPLTHPNRHPNRDRTNFDCDNLERFLNALGGGGKRGGGGGPNAYSCAVLAGARPMDERRRALRAFKDGEARFLIATDVGARGLDVSGLPYVINMTLPDRPEDYVHR